MHTRYKLDDSQINRTLWHLFVFTSWLHNGRSHTQIRVTLQSLVSYCFIASQIIIIPPASDILPAHPLFCIIEMIHFTVSIASTLTCACDLLFDASTPSPTWIFTMAPHSTPASNSGSDGATANKSFVTLLQCHGTLVCLNKFIKTNLLMYGN